MTPLQIKAAILGNVDPNPDLVGKCVTGGRLNAYKAVKPPNHIGSVSIVFDANAQPLPRTIGAMPSSMFYGTIGAFHLFNDGTWAVTEQSEGVVSYIVIFDPDNFPFSIYLELDPIPSEITSYLAQTNKKAVVPLTVEFPAYIVETGNCLYGAVTIDIQISGNGAVVLQSGDELEVIQDSIANAPYPIRVRPVSRM